MQLLLSFTCLTVLPMRADAKKKTKTHHSGPPRHTHAEVAFYEGLNRLESRCSRLGQLKTRLTKAALYLYRQKNNQKESETRRMRCNK